MYLFIQSIFSKFWMFPKNRWNILSSFWVVLFLLLRWCFIGVSNTVKSSVSAEPTLPQRAMKPLNRHRRLGLYDKLFVESLMLRRYIGKKPEDKKLQFTKFIILKSFYVFCSWFCKKYNKSQGRKLVGGDRLFRLSKGILQNTDHC